MTSLSLSLIEDAARKIDPYILKTPLEYSAPLSKLLGVPVHLKLEFLQKTGSFKLRGALFRLLSLSEQEKSKGVVTCSAGNHGKALACVGKILGIQVKVFVPKDVDQAKYEGILSYGANVVRSPYSGYDETEKLAREESQNSNIPYISPFDEDEIMAGNGGTLAREILEQLPEARTFIFPVGGGGLGAGLSYYVKGKHPEAHLIGCQHKDSAALKLSLEKGYALTELPPIKTIAGGIEGGIGANCFKYLKSRVDEVSLLSEEEIQEGVLWMLDKHQYLIEPSSAVAIAACLKGRIKKMTSPVVIILTGRNVSLTTIKSIVT